MIIEIILMIWGGILIFKSITTKESSSTLMDCIILSTTISQLLFMGMLWVMQICIQFFFTTCVAHGLFLFSILPRIVAGTRTLIVSAVWLATLPAFEYFSPRLLQVVYIVFKAVFMIIWLYDFVLLLKANDFPPEFGTVVDVAPNFTCPVCLENVSFYITLPCSHHFCIRCFCKWGSIHLNCPVCRATFSSWLHQLDLEPLLPISLIIV